VPWTEEEIVIREQKKFRRKLWRMRKQKTANEPGRLISRKRARENNVATKRKKTRVSTHIR
jgi:hypothetical protein